MEIVFLLILIGLMAFALGSGYPVAFALPGSAIIAVALAAMSGWLFAGSPDAYFAQGGPSQWLNAGVTNFRGIYWEVERDTLIAIPLFVFMGIMLQRSKIAEDLLITMAQLFGPIPGGLGISVVFVGALLAATTGIVGATVVAMGLISLPAMLRNNYSHSLATGTIAASGTLGQIIPPSIVLIILADQLASAVDQASTARKALFKESTGSLTMPSEFDVASTSAGEMFLGAFIPGLVLVCLYMLFILALALFRPKMAPTVRFEGAYDASFALKVFMTLVPPLTLIFVVLGSIIMGIATVNQAGAIGAVGAMIMAGYRLREGEPRAFWPAILAVISITVIITVTQIHPLNVKNIKTADDVLWMTIAVIAVVVFLVSLIWSGLRTLWIDDTLRGVMIETAKTTALVFIILLGAAMLTAAFRAFGGEDLVREFLTNLPGGFWTQFVIVMAVIFVLGFFLDFIEIAVVVVPIVAPILLMDPGANVTAVWLGVMIGLNIQTSFLTPPFGFALFYLRGVAPAIVQTLSIYKGVVPFICLQLLALVIVAWSPAMVNYLPLRLNLTGETAPPAINPRLQPCIEERLFERYLSDGGAIEKAIADAKALDLSGLPRSLRSDLERAIKQAEGVMGLVREVKAAEAALDERAKTYKPLHLEVRALQAAMSRIDREVQEHRQEIRRLAPDADARRAELEADIARIEAEKKADAALIPANWDAEHKAFVALQKTEAAARRKYRTAVDRSYEPIREALGVITAVDRLAEQAPVLRALADVVDRETPAAAIEQITSARSVFSPIPGTSDIGRALSSARSALRARTPRPDQAREQVAKAIEAFEAEVAWRTAANRAVAPGLASYEAAIRDSIGLRKQPKLAREQALEVAACMSNHRDLSLEF